MFRVATLALALACVALLATKAAAQPAAAPAAAPVSELDANVLAGWRAFEARRFADARARFERAAKLAPARADAQLGLAEALFWLGEHQAALARFERAAALAPRLAHAHSGAGHALLNLAGRSVMQPRTSLALLDRAEAAFDRALALDPNFAAARDGKRIIVELRRPKGASLFAIELPIALLLLALLVAGARALRAHGVPSLRALLWPIGLFVGTRVIVFAAFAVAPSLLPEAASHPLAIVRNPDNFVLDTVAGRWDANLYADVAVYGYRVQPNYPGSWGTVGQFPLLPVLFRWLTLALDDVSLAALVLPNAALLLACLFLFALFRAQYGPRLAAGALCALLVHPASLHGSVLYTESLALLGMAGAVLNLRRGAFVSAGLWGTFAGLARINTLAIVPWLLFEVWQAKGPRSLRSPRSLFAAIGPAIGLALFMLYLQLEFDNAFAYFDELRERRLSGTWLLALREAWSLLSQLTPVGPDASHFVAFVMKLFGLMCVAIYSAALVALVRERAFGPALFVAAGLALALGSNLVGQSRYLWPLFPVAVCIARACDRPIVRQVVPAVSCCALACAAVAFARWYFVP